MSAAHWSPHRGTVPDDLAALDAAWLNVFRQHRSMFDVTTAMIRLTEGSAHPTAITRIAEAVNQPVEETRRLLDRANTGSPWHRNTRAGDQVSMEFLGSETPRYWYHIGDRRIGVDGCGPDAFFAARALDVPLRLETTCPATGTAIAVSFAPDGGADVQPADAVVFIIHPDTALEAVQVIDAAQVDADICLQQPLFANAAAAQPWLDHHPGGRVVEVGTFDRWFRDLLARADDRATPQPGMPLTSPPTGHC